MFTRTYTALPAHNTIQFSLSVWILDVQSNRDLFTIYFDSQLISKWDTSTYIINSPGIQNVCAGIQPDYPAINLQATVPHSSQTVTVKIISSTYGLGGGGLSFGVRDLNLLFKTSAPAPSSTSLCKFNSVTDLMTSCLCQTGYYDIPSLVGCSQCNSACKNCINGNGAGDCTACQDNYYFNGTVCDQCHHSCGKCSGPNRTQCITCSSGKFLFPNGTCSYHCPAPYIQDFSGPTPLCNSSPSSCPSPQFSYQNNTCLSTCDSPFIQVSNQTCNFPCNSSSFLNWDYQCQTSCDYPFVQSLKGVERYCSLPCNSTDYLYENRTCQSSCPSPNFVQISLNNSIQYCNFSCPSGSFQNWGNQCQTSCDYPFVQSLTGVERYCSLPCDPTDYLYQNGTCQSSCPSDSFIEINIGAIQYCNFSCPPSSYRYWNHTCQDLCDAPFISITQGVEQYCGLPCSDQEFFYENGTCLDTCGSPFVVHEDDGYSTCQKPCANSWFFYWNTTCLPECPSTFQNSQNGVLTCDFFCSDNLYHCPNNTCQPECNYPFVQSVDNEGFRYCQNPCDEGEYLYENGSCISGCNYQISTDSNSISYCTYPCDPHQYLYENGTCSQFCPDPYLKETSSDGLQLCSAPCSSDEFYRQELEECVSHCSFPLVVKQEGLLIICQNMPIDNPPSNNTSDQNDTSLLNNIGETFVQLGAAFSSFASKASAASSWIRPNNKNSAFMISLAKSTKHIQLINFSPVEARILQEEVNITIDSETTTTGFSLTNMFTYKMPLNFKELFQSRSVHFQSISNSYFIVNMWESLTSFFSLILLGLFSIVCGYIAKKTQKQTLMLMTQKLKTLFRWNFVLFVLFNSYDDITFYTIIEFQTLKLDSFPAVLSFLTCLLVVGMAGFMLYKVFKITKESLQSHKKVTDVSSTDKSFNLKYSSYQVLHSGYHNDSFLKQGFLFISTCKTILCYLIIGCLYKFPIVQTSLLTVFSLLVIAYLLKENPTCDRFHLLIMLIFEVLGLMANICLLALAILASQNTTHIVIEERLIKTILVCNLASELAASIVLWIYVIIAIHTAWRKTKEGVPAKITWLNVLVSPFQTPGMEFCEENEMGELSATVVFRGRKRIIRGRWRRMPAKIAPAKLSNPETFTQNIIDLKTTPSLSQIFLKDSSLPTLKKTLSSQTNEKTPKGQKPFISLESEANGNAPESDPESLDGFTTSPSIIASSITGFMSPTSQEGFRIESPQNTPEVSRRTPKSRLMNKHERNKPSTSSVQKYLPSIIIEELSPALPVLKQDVSIVIETPVSDDGLLKQFQTIKTLKFDEDQTPKMDANMLLKSRCFDHQKKTFDNVVQEIILQENNAEDGSTKEGGLSNTFSKAIRTWRKTNTGKQDGSFVLNESSNNLNLSDLSLSLENFQRSNKKNLTVSSFQRRELLARSQMNSARTLFSPETSARKSDFIVTPQQSERRGAKEI